MAAPAEAGSSALLDELRLGEAGRRRIQEQLTALGYYGVPVDGVFGPETRAAIRRYQHELHEALTGQLTVDQANRLNAKQ